VTYVPQRREGTTIIITARDHDVGYQIGNHNVIRKPAMTFDNAETLFKNHHPSVEQSITAEEYSVHILQLFEELQYLPLAIIQVASYLEMNRGILTLPKYLQSFKQTKDSQKKLLSKPVYNSWRSNHSQAETVLTTYSITFRQIQEQSPLAGSLLQMMSCVDRLNIRHEFLAKSGLDRSDDEITLAEAIGKLHNFSLINITTSQTTDTPTRTYEPHSLVHLAIDCYQDIEERTALLLQTAKALARILPNDCRENSKIYPIYYPHAISLLQNINLDCDTLDVATICSKIALYTGRMANYLKLCPMHKEHIRFGYVYSVRNISIPYLVWTYSLRFTVTTVY
jgi:hypothetical protein